VPQIRQFEWADYEAVAAVWAAAGRDVVPRAELQAKLTRDPELFLVAERQGGWSRW
jgi:ribosomal protein S18 acetylase RimI-like enzyme